MNKRINILIAGIVIGFTVGVVGVRCYIVYRGYESYTELQQMTRMQEGQIQQEQVDINQLNQEIQKLKQEAHKSDIKNGQDEQRSHSTSTISRGGSFLSYDYAGKYRVTAYNLSYQDCGKHPSDKDYGITSSGTKVQEWRTIAMDKHIPYGVKVYIPYFKDKPNKGIFINEDHGGAISGNRIDVYMESSNDCTQFGVRYLEVYIVR